MNAAQTAPRTYAVGDAVEVRTFDFKAAGMPRVWAAGTVAAVAVIEGKVLDVSVAVNGGTKVVRTTYRSRAVLRPAA